MSGDFEEIQLVGGPADGRLMPWDGGNYVTIKEAPPTTLFGNATKEFRELMVKSHTYIRDPIQRGRFVYQGDLG